LHEGQVEAETWESLRVERKNVLEDEYDEGEAHLENIYNDHGEEILSPSHPASRIYSKQSVDPILDGAEDSIYPIRCTREDASDVWCE
jgi:hypothetical protein